ncbi:hypothetical protein PMZ80_003779 [Knufia obscura]|uniref:Uncharacterized protein n=1 Tax=Knufia obscura TaxID=1635080 RepID=A0ABR0RVP0_9EURO|nr:hypothetical protein PMZ80_003779 [Knufia obscura]
MTNPTTPTTLPTVPIPRNISLLSLAIPFPPTAPPNFPTLLQSSFAKAATNNIHLEHHTIDPHLPATESLSGLPSLISSRKWDVISIGFGLRGNKELTGLFEGVVNLVVEFGCGYGREGQGEGKGNGGKRTRLAFAVVPDEICEVAGRVMG